MKRYHRRRPKREPKKKKRPSAPPEKSTGHPLFGEIPLIEDAVTDGRGNAHRFWRPDPDYRPVMPKGAVRGDIRKQLFCNACHDPKYFFVDEPRRCVQCGDDFTFRAAEQKFWYETLKFNFASVPIRCAPCRRKRRSEAALREQVAVARRGVEAAPDDPAHQLALARAIVDLHERTRTGPLGHAVAAARKARTLWPESAEPFLWEGLAHALAGRRSRARTQLEAFLERSPKGPRLLRGRAEHCLDSIDAP